MLNYAFSTFFIYFMLNGFNIQFGLQSGKCKILMYMKEYKMEDLNKLYLNLNTAVQTTYSAFVLHDKSTTVYQQLNRFLK